MSKTTTNKKQNDTKVSRTPKKATTSIKKTTKATQNAYFWGGIGIILCATGALLTLLWGIGNMLNR